jgi:succinyl-CoA synthetase alpha subunit
VRGCRGGGRAVVIVRRDDRVLVQGITGRQGTFWTERMIECGTRVVGGVSPKRAGGTCCGVPVFASAEHAAAGIGFDVAGHVHPAGGALAAAQEAIKAGRSCWSC